jgi:hypothetical protein
MSLLEILRKYANSPRPVLSEITPFYTGNDWLFDTLGISEEKDIFKSSKSNVEKFKAINCMFKERVLYDEGNGSLVFMNKTGPKIFQAGWFISPTCKEIRKSVSEIGKRGQLTITVITGEDAGIAHIKGEHCEVFQGASQFNALEMMGPEITPYDGIDGYIYDPTQGPRVALACVPGTFIRNYLVNTQYGGQFNALEKLHLCHNNGYLLWGTDPLPTKRKVLNDEIVSELMIPCMLYTQVAGVTRTGPTKAHCTSKLVHQIYSSAVPVGVYGNGGNNDTQLIIAEKIIKAGYIGAIGMAIILHFFDKELGNTTLLRPRVNLTLIGGGVFNVPTELVLKSLKEAIEVYREYECDIHIHGHRPETAQKISSFFENAFKPQTSQS